jgi:hypothetical protein
MEPQAALEGAEGRVELDTEAAVDLHGTAVIDPGDPEDDLALRLAQSVQHRRVDVLGVLGEDRTEALKDLVDGLMKLGLARVPSGHFLIDPADVFV